MRYVPADSTFRRSNIGRGSPTEADLGTPSTEFINFYFVKPTTVDKNRDAVFSIGWGKFSSVGCPGFQLFGFL